MHCNESPGVRHDWRENNWEVWGGGPGFSLIGQAISSSY